MQIISTVAWDRIAAVDEDYCTIMKQCARESALYERKLWKQREGESEARVRALGGTVTELSEEALSEFRRAVEPLYESYPEPIRRQIQIIREN